MNRTPYGIRWCICLLAGMLAAGAGCRPPEPTPSHYQDMGNESMPLLPTRMTQGDATILEGRAEWRALREPRFADGGNRAADKAPGNATAAGQAGPVESEIRAMIVEYNDLLKEGAYGDVAEFYVEDQVSPVERLIEVMPSLRDKLRELLDALPEKQESLAAALDSMSLEQILRLEVEQITSSDDGSMRGRLKGVPPGLPISEVRFVKDDEGFWYVDSPAIAMLKAQLPLLDQSIAGIDQLIAGIKSGEIPAEAVSQQLSGLGMMMSALQPAEAPPAAEAPPPDEDE